MFIRLVRREQEADHLNVILEDVLEGAVSEAEADSPIQSQVFGLGQVGHLFEQLVDGLQPDQFMFVVVGHQNFGEFVHQTAFEVHVVEPGQLRNLAEHENPHPYDLSVLIEHLLRLLQPANQKILEFHFVCVWHLEPAIGHDLLQSRGRQILDILAGGVLDEENQLVPVGRVLVERSQIFVRLCPLL